MFKHDFLICTFQYIVFKHHFLLFEYLIILWFNMIFLCLIWLPNVCKRLPSAKYEFFKCLTLRASCYT